MADVVEEIKSRLNIEDLVAQYVQLKKAGRNFKGLCPFHSEKTPSFMVSPDKQIAYCFGCHKGGDLFKFLQEVEGVDFPGAVKILADRAGVKLEKTTFSKYQTNKDEKDAMIDAHGKARDFYKENLWETKSGEKVLLYLRNRGVKDEIIKEFELGFSPDSFSETNEFLLKEKFDRKMLVSAGLVSRKDTTGSKIYDRFRSRLMFPINDSLGRTVGFGGRALKKDDEPKYLNTAETLIYHKSNILYGFDKSKQEIKKEGVAILVEGYMDLLMSFQAGVKNVVAVSGTALTEGHLKIIKRIASKVVFAFDTDKAGMEAAKRAFLLADKIGLQTFMVDLGGDKDPADFVKEHPDDWLKKIEQAEPFMEVFLALLDLNCDVKTISGKKEFLKEALPYLDAISSSVERDFYIRHAASFIQVEPQIMYDELKKFKRTPDHVGPSTKEKETSSYEHNFSAEEHLMALLLAFPNCFHHIEKKLEDYKFEGVLDSIYKEFLSQYNSHRAEADISFDCNELDDEKREKAMLLMLFGEEKNAYLGSSGLNMEANKLIDTLQKGKYLNRRTNLVHEIKMAEKQGNKELVEKLMKDLVTHNSIVS